MTDTKTTIALSAALAMLLLAASADLVGSQPAPAVPPASLSHETGAIPMEPPFSDLRNSWSAHLQHNALAETVAMYAEEATFADPAARTTGHVAIERLMRRIMGEVDSTVVLESTRSERSGGLAVDSGTYREQLTWRVDGRRQRNQGSYLTVYRRADDGRWLIIEQSWTPGTAKN